MSTVSRVLNGGYASAPVRKRVEAAVRELGYSPSPTARSLVTGRTGSIGVVAHTSQSPWFTQLLGGIEEALATSRHSVLLGSLAPEGHYDASTVTAWVTERRVDGLIFARSTKRERPLLRSALRAGLPVVLVAPDVTAGGAITIRCQNVEAGRLAGLHLLELGHRRIAFAGGPEDSVDSQDRQRGLQQALTEHGVTLTQEVDFCSSYDPQSGIEYAERFVERAGARRSTAVVLGNDALALGFMRRVLQSGWSIPRDVSVIGFDGVPDGGLFWPGLTTIAQPTRTMGATACQVLLDRIFQRDTGTPSAVEFDPRIEVRESTGQPSDRRGKRVSGTRASRLRA